MIKNGNIQRTVGHGRVRIVDIQPLIFLNNTSGEFSPPSIGLIGGGTGG